MVDACNAKMAQFGLGFKDGSVALQAGPPCCESLLVGKLPGDFDHSLQCKHNKLSTIELLPPWPTSPIVDTI